MDKKYDHLSLDAQAQKKWADEQTYAIEKSDKELYSIDTPPPTVSGTLHIGHIFSYTHTDIIARFKRLSGFNVFYPFGFDDNGLPTEKFVEKKHKVTGFGMGRTEFINLCMDESKKAQEEFSVLWQRMGISADWNKTYSTISPLVRKISQTSFVDLHKKGFIYRKEDPALYCTTCFTTVAQAELDDVEKASHFCDVAFKTTDGQELVIATTRPELLPSCVALFFHPDDKRYQALKDKKAITPLFNHEVPILADETVDPEKGTGLVMCCTFGDKNDIYWYKTHKLPYRPSVGRNGKWDEGTGILAGLKAHIAREKVIEELDKAGLLKAKKPIKHSVNVHERCKKDIEYIVIKQWFLNILEHKQAFLTQADKIDWHPSFMQARYKDWVENLQWDWCLSRQRFYGIPFPAWHCNTCKQILIAQPEDLPIDPQETAYPGGACPQCSSTDLVPDTDIMDTWNTSSVSPYICAALFSNDEDTVFETAAESNFIPMGLRPQAHDIIRTWAFYTIIKSWMHNKQLPWKEIVISGHVLSADRDKISKSKGNNPTDPTNLLKLYPADVIRFWTASGTLGNDVAFSESQLKIGFRLITKLWNAFRFVKEHIDQAPSQQPKQLGAINEWLLHRASETFKKYNDYLNKHEFSLALNILEQFFWQDFCDNYLEIIKNQLFNPDLYSEETVEATRWTLYHIGLRILQLFAPYLPHITETLYGTIYESKEDAASIHQTEFANAQKDFDFPESIKTAEMLINIIGAVRKMKTAKELSLKVPLSSLTLHSVDKGMLKTLVPHEQLLKGISQAAVISYGTGDVEHSTLDKEHDAWFATLDLDHISNEGDE
jgi:valyl-tRNA synthetase